MALTSSKRKQEDNRFTEGRDETQKSDLTLIEPDTLEGIGAKVGEMKSIQTSLLFDYGISIFLGLCTLGGVAGVGIAAYRESIPMMAIDCVLTTAVVAAGFYKAREIAGKYASLRGLEKEIEDLTNR